MATPTPMSTPGFNLENTPTREMYGMITPGRDERKKERNNG